MFFDRLADNAVIVRPEEMPQPAQPTQQAGKPPPSVGDDARGTGEERAPAPRVGANHGSRAITTLPIQVQGKSNTL